MRKSLVAAWSFAVVVGLSVPAFAQLRDGVVREGEGARRIRLDGIERKPFDFAAFGKLADWKNGAALSAGVAAGKPVLILTWTDYVPQSKRALTLARRMAEKHGAQGLIVVAAHSAQEWDAADKVAAPKDATFLLAHDKDGEFRKSLSADADPDFFLIDRAGQLRFADIVTESVETACDTLVKESGEDAGSVNMRLKAAADAAEAEARRTEALRQGVDLTNLPEQPFEEPSADVYKKAAWPNPPEDEQARQQLQPGQKYDPFADLPRFSTPDTAWFPSKSVTKGRVTILYFWHPEARFSVPQIDAYELVQRQRGRDVAVVGVVSPIGDNSGQSKFNMEPDFLKPIMTKFQGEKALKHRFMVDPEGQLWEMSTRTYTGTQSYPMPWGLLVGSDGTVHWWGHLGSPKGQAALDKMLAVDPGVQARRQAEESYIKSRTEK
ncbi:hypothetical protein PHYC_01150 [Phycisphaerales bacterium]|nr:hypothetical protein PHYC_01150 [Phycisphaerales bacterium]